MAKNQKTALLSVYDKTGIVEFARGLIKLNFEIISTGGTAKTLEETGIKITPIQEVTGNPESFDGRMKTVSFQIESGILFDRTNPEHVKQAEELGIKPIDLVVCNLYPFESDPSIETIDVGGPTMLRAAAKNYQNVLPVCDPEDYKEVIHVISNYPTSHPEQTPSVILRSNEDEGSQDSNENKSGDLSLSARDDNEKEFRTRLAQKTFEHLSFYDSQIAEYFRNQNSSLRGSTKQSLTNKEELLEIATPAVRDDNELFPKEFTLPGRKIQELRYGENPHQKAALYTFPKSNSPLSKLEKHWGRDLSLVNVTDIDAGLSVVRMFNEPAAVVIKHNTPCGIALGSTGVESLSRAIEADPVSAFGGVIVMNRSVDLESAKIIADFKHQSAGNIDIVAVPGIDKDALELLQSVRKSMGIYTFGEIPKEYSSQMNVKSIEGGFILQNADQDLEDGFKNWEVVTEKKPTEKQLEQMKIAWKFVTRIRSNCVLVMDPELPMTRGIGSGQTSRVGSTNIALEQAGEYAKGAILASDSFFPFPDSVGLASKAGISAIIQQGDSVNDKPSIAEANKASIPMIFTHRRAFWH